MERDLQRLTTTVSNRDLDRYDRQISIKDFGERGQLRLKKAHVVVAGIGGVGSAVSMYLAVAGIGHLTVIDSGKVELSNLNRQVLHWEEDLGSNKAKSAAAKLRQLNTDIEVTSVEESIEANNVSSLLQGADTVVDCLDNFSARYALNDAAVKLNMPAFHAACFGFEGRVTTIIPRITPCLRCIYPRGLQLEKVPIIGSIAGTIGNIAATEAIKFFVGLEPTLKNKLLIYDGQRLIYNLVNISRNPECPSCREMRIK